MSSNKIPSTINEAAAAAFGMNRNEDDGTVEVQPEMR
jgi:hypothetical protein